MQLSVLAGQFAKPVLALAMIAAVYAATRSAVPPAVSRADAGPFRFSRRALPEVSGPESRNVRPVHPSLRRIQSWISAVGAAVALNDLDGNGLSDDVCYVDTRTDQVIVAPVPGTPQRYAPFALALNELRYDRSTMAPMGCLPGDFNEDGATDLLVYFWGRPPAVFLKRDRSAAPGAAGYQAKEIIAPSQGEPERWYTNAAVLGDIDGDGHIDIVIGNYFPDGSRILDANDGGREHMQHSMSRAFNGGSKRVLLSCFGGNSPDACFREAPDALPEEARQGWTLAMGVADLDGDLLPEIYFANDFGPDRLLHNRSTPGHPRFALLEARRGWATPKSKVLGRDSFKGMGVDFGDVNGDGIPDIFVSNIAAEYALEESHFAFLSTGSAEPMRRGVAPYVDRAEELGLSRSGWAWDVRLGDFDNDGTLEILRAGGFLKGGVNRWPELHELAMGNDQLLEHPSNWPKFQAGADISGGDRNRFQVRGSDGRYADIAKALGVDGPFVTRGIATADVDGDGRLDFAIGNQWQPSLFFRNETAGTNSFLGLHLLRPCDGSVSNGGARVTPGHERPCSQAAIGATARVKLPGGGTRSGASDGGSGHSGKRSPDVLLGLGPVASNTSVELELRWRDGHGEARSAALNVRPGWYTVLLD